MGQQQARRKSRNRPLETFGSVILGSVHVVYTRIKTLKNPASSSVVQKFLEAIIFFASLTSPFHRHLLAILSVTDDHILALQDTIETYFPSSTFAFLKISHALVIIKNVPQKLDGFLENLPGLMNKALWVDWVLIHVIYWLDSLVNVLDRWRDQNKGTKEKEITVDRSFIRSRSISQEREENMSRIEGKKATYKEALQRGSSGEDGGGSIGRK